MHETGGPEVLKLDEVDTPTPGPGEVLVEVAAAGVAYGDIMQRSGAFGPVMTLPRGVGLQVAGTVAALGDRADIGVGARVAATVEAGYAEYALARTDALIPLLDSVDLTAASCLPVQGVTAYQVLADSARIQPGESVLVHAAAGGVGGLAVQLARLMGATRVIGTAAGPDKLERVHELGADTAIDYRDPRWPDIALDATAGAGVDVVLDSVGGDVAARSAAIVAPFGRTVVYGAAAGPHAPDPMRLMQINASVVGYSLFGWHQRPERMAHATQQLTALLRAGDLQIAPGQTFPLEQASRAHALIEARATQGTTALLVGQGT